MQSLVEQNCLFHCGQGERMQGRDQGLRDKYTASDLLTLDSTLGLTSFNKKTFGDIPDPNCNKVHCPFLIKLFDFSFLSFLLLQVLSSCIILDISSLSDCIICKYFFHSLGFLSNECFFCAEAFKFDVILFAFFHPCVLCGGINGTFKNR